MGRLIEYLRSEPRNKSNRSGNLITLNKFPPPASANQKPASPFAC